MRQRKLQGRCVLTMMIIIDKIRERERRNKDRDKQTDKPLGKTASNDSPVCSVHFTLALPLYFSLSLSSYLTLFCTWSQRRKASEVKREQHKNMSQKKWKVKPKLEQSCRWCCCCSLVCHHCQPTKKAL